MGCVLDYGPKGKINNGNLRRLATKYSTDRKHFGKVYKKDVLNFHRGQRQKCHKHPAQ
jgi:hypothetical protein